MRRSAPHEDLVAYLVRRLLENGANTSFVNRLADEAAPIEEIVARSRRERRARERMPASACRARPRDLLRPSAVNSAGLALSEPSVRGALLARDREPS